uniref:VWFA domain-containing protein n=2 Tax=Ciona intestinalis TaxID=7719 RepID=H2XU05_CIOIN
MRTSLREMYICASMIVILCASMISAQNIETREFHSLSPIKSDSAVIHFGASVVIKTSPMKSIAYVGAPADGNKNGSVYKCSFSGKSYGNTSCSKDISFDNNAAIGMSIGADSSFSNLYICGNQHTTSCPTTPLQKRMVGACYKKPMTSSTATMFKTPCVPGCPKIILIADIMFVLDDSSSVDDTAFRSALNWIIQVVSYFSSYIDSGDLRVGVYGFSNDDHRSGIRIG